MGNAILKFEDGVYKNKHIGALIKQHVEITTKGEKQGTKEGFKIRQKLRNMGFYLSKPETHIPFIEDEKYKGKRKAKGKKIPTLITEAMMDAASNL